MDNSTLSREPIAETVVEKTETTSLKESEAPKDELPISLYRESGRLPYLCDLLEIKDEYTHFDMKDKSNFIDEYILSKVESKDDYKQMFENLLEKGKINRESVYKIVDDLHEFLSIQKKLEDAVKEKEEFDKRDPLSMNSSQLRKWITSRIK